MSEEKTQQVQTESVKQELCALPKEFAQKQMQRLIDENKDVFEEYMMWQNAVKSEVKITEEVDDEPEQASE